MLREIPGILVLSIVLALGYNMFSPRALPILRRQAVKNATPDSALFSWNSGTVDSTAQNTPHVIAPLRQRALANPDSMAKLYPKKDTGYGIVSLDQVKRLLKEKRGVFIDARELDEYDKGHLPGARNIPYLEYENHFSEIMQIPQDTLVVIYCTSNDCPLGRDLVDFMRAMEFKRVMLYDDGWEGWEKAGMDKEGALK
jgi:rhodanese-related sulfurtransferase